MPIYDFHCDVCGPFKAMRPMMQFRDSCTCPKCGTETPRTILSAPGIVSENSARSAHTASEPSASNLRRTSTAHPAGCGCCMRRWPLPGGLSAKGGRVFTSHGPIRRSGQ